MKKQELNKIQEKLEEISSKLDSIDISKAFELSKLYVGKDVLIQVNSLIPHLVENPLKLTT
jgi:tetrahydromethanopterin S-methyltransferase subunit G